MNAMRSLTRIRRHKEELNRADENKIEVKKKYTRKNQHILEDTEGWEWINKLEGRVVEITEAEHKKKIRTV